MGSLLITVTGSFSSGSMICFFLNQRACLRTCPSYPQTNENPLRLCSCCSLSGKSHGTTFSENILTLLHKVSVLLLGFEVDGMTFHVSVGLVSHYVPKLLHKYNKKGGLSQAFSSLNTMNTRKYL